MREPQGGGTDSLIILGDPLEVERSAEWLPELSGAKVASWEIEFNSTVLAGDTPHSSELARQGTYPRLSSQRIRLDLPGGREGLTLFVDTLREDDAGILTYAGRIEGEVAWLFTLTVENDRLLGKFHMDDRLFLVYTTEAGRQLLHEIDQRRVPRLSHNHDRETRPLVTRQAMSCSNYSPNALNGNIRVLFLYTPDVSSGISSLVNSIIAQFNQSLLNSGVDAKNYITSAGLLQLPSNLDGRCWGQFNSQFSPSDSIMGMMREGLEPFSNLSQWLNQNDADVALLITSEDESASVGGGCFTNPNLGRIGGKAFIFFPDWPYAGTTKSYALGDLTALHEMGHVLGGLHEANSDPGFWGTPDCGLGYAQPGTNPTWMTVMGGYVNCAFDPWEPPNQQSCKRIPIWSNDNPFITYQEQPTGNVGHNMARALNMTMTEVAAWRSYPHPVPGIPTSIYSSSNCYWMNQVSWGSVSGADHYQLFKSNTSNFQSQWLISQGPGTDAWDLGPGYYRVRACNGSGCGSYSSGVAAKYFNGCL